MVLNVEKVMTKQLYRSGKLYQEKRSLSDHSLTCKEISEFLLVCAHFVVPVLDLGFLLRFGLEAFGAFGALPCCSVSFLNRSLSILSGTSVTPGWLLLKASARSFSVLLKSFFCSFGF